MSDIIDISMPLHAGIPVWPGSTGFHLTRTKQIGEGEAFNVSRLDTDVHVGTHVDAPRHVIRTGGAVDQLSLETLVGPAEVAHLTEGNHVTEIDLERLSLPPDTQRLLLKTRNSEWGTKDKTTFREDFTALTAEAAQWIVDRGIRLIGIDYLSIQRFHDAPLTHEILLQAEVVILEGLVLHHVEPGLYELICLPLRLVGAEGAPARVVVRPLSS